MDIIQIYLISDKKTAVREKECAVFDDLWNVGRYKYKVPSKSFCSDYCWYDSNPNWFECTRNIMPQVVFFMGNNKRCTVLTKNGWTDKTNKDCISRVARYLISSKDPNAKLVYLTHGYTQNEPKWMEETKDILLERYMSRNIVVGLVYWAHGARAGFTRSISSRSTTPDYITQIIENFKQGDEKSLQDAICCSSVSYGTAAPNTWAIGNILAYVNKQIAYTVMPNKIKTFCIGHSLGAHLCGFFGKMVKILNPKFPLDKIIGLDPAGPIFEWKDSDLHQDPDLRLNKADATNVEIFHTSFTWGFADPLGDTDFYINGGHTQPACYFDILPQQCSHGFAKDLFKLVNNKAVSCSANWKCTITDGSSLENIDKENESELKHAGCFHQPGVILGNLDQTTTNNHGIFWVGVDKTSKTCKTP
jgi:hypothetical protein